MVRQYGFTDFGQGNQDLAAVALIAGRGALADALAGRIPQAIAKCAREWASLPGSPYGQPMRTIEQALATYAKHGGTLAGENQSTTADTPTPAPAARSPKASASRPTRSRKSSCSFGPRPGTTSPFTSATRCSGALSAA